MAKKKLLQKKALGVIFSKSHKAHTEPLLKIVSQPKLSDLYIITFLKLYYKLYRNRPPTYLECFCRNMEAIGITYATILPTIQCEFEEMNAKYQMYRTLGELASPGDSALYPTIQINDSTLGTSYKAFPMYL